MKKPKRPSSRELFNVAAGALKKIRASAHPMEEYCGAQSELVEMSFDEDRGIEGWEAEDYLTVARLLSEYFVDRIDWSQRKLNIKPPPEKEIPKPLGKKGHVIPFRPRNVPPENSGPRALNNRSAGTGWYAKFRNGYILITGPSRRQEAQPNFPGVIDYYPGIAAVATASGVRTAAVTIPNDDRYLRPIDASAIPVEALKALKSHARSNPANVEKTEEFTSALTRRLTSKGAMSIAASGFAKKAAPKVAAKTAAKVGAKSATKLIPIIGWTIAAIDAAPEAWAVAKEGVASQKKMMHGVWAEKGVKAKGKAFATGVVENFKLSTLGNARIAAAAVVGSDVVRLGREAYANPQKVTGKDACGRCDGEGYAGPHGDTCTRCEGSGSDPWQSCEGDCGKSVRESTGMCRACRDAEDEENGVQRDIFGYKLGTFDRKKPKSRWAFNNPKEKHGLEDYARYVTKTDGRQIPSMIMYGAEDAPIQALATWLVLKEIGQAPFWVLQDDRGKARVKDSLGFDYMAEATYGEEKYDISLSSSRIPASNTTWSTWMDTFWSRGRSNPSMAAFVGSGSGLRVRDLVSAPRPKPFNRATLPARAFLVPERRAWPVSDKNHCFIAFQYMTAGRGNRAEYPKLLRKMAQLWPVSENLDIWADYAAKKAKIEKKCGCRLPSAQQL